MSLGILAVVIGAALLHATWNAIVKAAPDKLLTTVLVAASGALVALVLLPFIRSPAPESWSYAGCSVVLQVVYYVLVAQAYGRADMSQAYPLMRGTAPLIVAAVMATVGSESLPVPGWAGIVAICAGIFSIAFGGAQTSRTGVYIALLNAAVIAAYTIVDGVGVRRSGAPASYTLWVFLLTGTPLLIWMLLAKHGIFLDYVGRYWRLGILGGIGTTASYGLALWAMTKAPVALIAALRETSIVFGTLLAWLVLKEKPSRQRLIGALIVAVGAMLLRVS